MYWPFWGGGLFPLHRIFISPGGGGDEGTALLALSGRIAQGVTRLYHCVTMWLPPSGGLCYACIYLGKSSVALGGFIYFLFCFLFMILTLMYTGNFTGAGCFPQYVACCCLCCIKLKKRNLQKKKMLTSSILVCRRMNWVHVCFNKALNIFFNLLPHILFYWFCTTGFSQMINNELLCHCGLWYLGLLQRWRLCQIRAVSNLL